MTPHLVSANGEEVTPEPRQPMSAKQIVFDWSGLVAVAMAAISWGYNSNQLDTLKDEVARLRAGEAQRVEERVYIAREMATKTDINVLTAKFEAFAAEMRSRTNK